MMDVNQHHCPSPKLTGSRVTPRRVRQEEVFGANVPKELAPWHGGWPFLLGFPENDGSKMSLVFLDMSGISVFLGTQT